MPQLNRNDKYALDLSTVTRVRIAGEWHDISPGTFLVGRPAFTMPDDAFPDAIGVEVYGEGWHPLSYFFTTRPDGVFPLHHTGPYHHVQQLTYAPQR